MPTVVGRNDNSAGLLAHAKKYGSDGVMEAARDFWCSRQMSTDDVIALQESIDNITPTGRYASKVKHRLSATERVERLLGLEPTQEEEDGC